MTEYRQRYGAKNSWWRIVYPLLVYLLLQLLAAYAVGLFFTMILIPQYYESILAGDIYGYMSAVLGLYVGHILEITGLSAAVSIPLSLFMLRVDREERVKAGIPTRFKQSWLPFLLMILAGLAACFLGNVLISISGVSEISGDAAQIDLMAGGWISEIIFAGIIVPIAEELCFRALMYRRTRDYLGMIPSMFITAAIFGAVHGTLANFLYAFALGLLMAWLYERFKNIWATILVHMSANILSVVLTECEPLWDLLAGSILRVLVSCLVCALVLIAVVVFVETKVKPKAVDGKKD